MVEFFRIERCSAKERGREVRRRAARLICVVVVAAFLMRQSTSAGSVREVRRVLIINDLGIISSPGFAEVVQAVLTGLQKSPYQIELYEESLDFTLFPDRVSQDRFREEIIQKYSARKPDVIIAAGPVSLKFIAKLYSKFQSTPIIFCAIWDGIPDEVRHGMPFTGVVAQLNAEGTLNAALHLLPSTKHVVVVGGVGKFDEGFEAIAKQSFHKYESKLEFTYLFDLTMPALIERLKHLPSDTIIYHTAISQDAAGDRFIDSAQSIPMVASAANAPVFVMDDVDLRAGTVGGDLVNWADDAGIAAAMAVRVLNGEKPQDIPIVKSPHVYMFDWHALKRWGLKERNLPPGSIVLNRQTTVWESYKWYIISGISLIFLEALLIGGLVWQRARRRKVEADLSITYDRLRLAVEAGKSVGWDWHVQSGRNQWFGDLQAMFGIPADSYSGHAEDFYRTVHPEERELVRKAVADARQSRSPYSAEFRIIRADGTVRWVTASGKFYYAPNGDPERMLGVAMDITERKRAEEALRQRETELEDAQRLAGLGSWQWEPRTDTVIWSKELYHLIGIDPTLPAPSYKEHATLFAAESWERLQSAVQGALQTGKSYELDLEVVRPESIVKWEIARGEPVRDESGQIIGLRGTVQDITERKLAEAALADVSRKLIEAQEQERSRIGRELHDDIAQRLAMVAIELQQLHQDPLVWPEVRSRMGGLQNRISEIATDIQSLSHELHSAKLQYLGITGAMRGFCHEFAEQQKVEIEINAHDLPTPLSPDISLCLFRVLQEALHNSAKHSGVKRFEVRLWGTSEEIHLTIKDSGAGFDRDAAKASRGLGLISMEERLKLVKGTLSIESQPKGGTTIHARVPFDSGSDSARAAG